MRYLLTLLAATLFAVPAAAHPGMGDNAAHDTMHAVGGFEIALAAFAVVLVAWLVGQYLRSPSIRRK